MDPDSQLRGKILDTLALKASLKQIVADNTAHSFGMLKEILHEIATEIDEEIEEKIDKRIKIEYRDRGKYEAQIQVAEDILIFSMHTDVFRFHDDHPVWENSYVKDNPGNAFCGVINIYNFLADSFKFNRAEDEGYLVGRIFINRQTQYFTDGKIETPVKSANFGTAQLDASHLKAVLESAVYYALDFDLFVPPYEQMKIVSVEQFNTKTENSKLQTGKRIGYEFRCDDVES